jgi:GPH family glycoside/pentoside/hexuronide:cation symporter/glucuronide carrier protein
MDAQAEVEIRQQSLLSFKEKLAFFTVNIGNIPIMTLLGSFLLIFYTDVVGLDPIQIGTLFLISRVLDGINDPIMGFVIDHLPRTKWGRFRPYLVLGTVILCLNYLVLWLGPSMATSGKMAIAFISYILFGFTFDLMDIPLNSMIPVMSDRDRDRSALSNIKGVAYLAGGIIITIGALPLIESFSSKQQGFHVVIMGATLFVLLFSILGALGIKERIAPVNAEKYGIQDALKILRARPVSILFLNTLILHIGNGMYQGIALFFFIYVIKRSDLYPVAGASYIVGIIAAIFLTPILVRRIGSKSTKSIANILALVGMLMMFFVPASQPYVFIAILIVTSPGVGINQILFYGLQADATDYIEWKFGYRAEGVIASVFSFIIKAGLGVGSAMGAYFLGIYHYVPNQTQTAETIQGLYTVSFLIPGLLAVLAVIIWIFGYPLTKKAREKMMIEMVEIRHAKDGYINQ